MYDDILLPTDGSSGTLEALRHALTIARDHDATVHGLYVLDSRQYRAASEETKADVVRSLEEEGERALDDVRVRTEDEGLAAETTQCEGVPPKVIVEYADEHAVDLIVMGTHGRTGADRLANLGSTTERVVSNGEHPVLVVAID